jgi:hypothetical protein
MKKEIEIGNMRRIIDDKSRISIFVEASKKLSSKHETHYQSFTIGLFPYSRWSCAKHKNYVLYIFDLIDQICQRFYRCVDSHFDGKKVMTSTGGYKLKQNHSLASLSILFSNLGSLDFWEIKDVSYDLKAGNISNYGWSIDFESMSASVQVFRIFRENPTD